MMLALTPPKPKPFDMACSIFIARACAPTRSSPPAAASELSRLRVGGAIWPRSASTVKIASRPPAKQVSSRRFGRADSNRCVWTKHGFDRHKLADISERGRCGVSIQVLDIRRGEMGLAQGDLHGPARAFAILRAGCHVISIRRRASNRAQAVSAPEPSGDTTPKPVTTTRRIQVT